MAAPLHNLAIHCYPLTWLHNHHIAHADRIDGDLPVTVASTNAGDGRPQRLKRTDCFGSLPLGPGLKPLAQQDQRDDNRGGFKIQVRHLTACRLCQEIYAESVGRSRSKGHQEIHVPATCTQCLPACTVETQPQPELNRGCQQQLHPAGQHPMCAEEISQHRNHERKGEGRRNCNRPPFGTLAD